MAPMSDVRGTKRLDPVTFDVTVEESRGLYVGTTGDVSIVVGGVTRVVPNVAGGFVHPFYCTKVNSVGTAAAAGQYFFAY